MADPFLGVFAKLKKTDISFAISVRLPGRIFMAIYI
jgi:hypothetical protein